MAFIETLKNVIFQHINIIVTLVWSPASPVITYRAAIELWVAVE
jgi:hypothetical protein